jgi:hypothetical protein
MNEMKYMVEQTCMCLLLDKLGRMAVLLREVMLHGITAPGMLI